MGYSDAPVGVYIDVLGPLFVPPGLEVDGIHCYQLRDAQAEGMPWHLARPPISLVCYCLGNALVSYQAPKG